MNIVPAVNFWDHSATSVVGFYWLTIFGLIIFYFIWKCLFRKALAKLHIINSCWFIEFLSHVTGVDNFIPDPLFYGGGLHDETRNGGRFEIHIDFNKHYQALLDNEIVIINYLNKDWQASGRRVGIMGCWHAQSEVEVLPERGITVILRHDLKSLRKYIRH